MNSKGYRVLFILEHFFPYLGGVEQLFGQLTKALAGRGVEVTVLTTRHDPTLPVEEMLEGVRIRRIRAGNRYLFTLLALPLAIRYAIRARVVFTSTYNAAVPAFIAAALARKPVIITVHEVWGHLWFRFPWLGKAPAALHFLFEKLVISLPFRRMVAVSDFTRATLLHRGITPEKVEMVHNGLDYNRIDQYRQPRPEGFSPSPEKFIYYGRLGHSKGLDLIVKGGARYLQKNPGAVIELVVPEVPRRFRRRLEKEVASTPCRDRILITASLPEAELFRRLQDATAVLIPSRSEGFCYVAAECAALGVPVISSGQGALTETAGGKVVTLSSLTPDGLCEAMEKACAGEFKDVPVRRFPLEDQVQQYLDLLDL
ncbi:MAG: glycosyltransferase family 4 protein [Bacteroidales bacterium]